MTMRDMLIKQKLDQLFVDWNNKKGARGGLHASSILAPEKGNNQFCYREQVLNMFFKPVVPALSPRLLQIFLHGWSLHEKWQSLFVECGVAVQVETTRKSSTWDLYHTPDAIIEILGRKYVVEIKSMSTFQFVKLNTPPANAIRQVQLYMHLTGIPDGIVLVEDKNNQDFKVWEVEYDPEFVAPFLSRLDNIQKLLKIYKKDQRLPRRLLSCESIESGRAKNCPLRDACFGVSRDPL